MLPQQQQSAHWQLRLHTFSEKNCFILENDFMKTNEIKMGVDESFKKKSRFNGKRI